jgi:hypothetical protein
MEFPARDVGRFPIPRVPPFAIHVTLNQFLDVVAHAVMHAMTKIENSARQSVDILAFDGVALGDRIA